MVPRANNNTVPGTWVFKIKCKPDGSLSKFKARFCVRGDLQSKDHLAVEDVCAPAVSWATIRLLLVSTQRLGLKTLHLDFSNAFAQADMPADKPVCLDLHPR